MSFARLIASGSQGRSGTGKLELSETSFRMRGICLEEWVHTEKSSWVQFSFFSRVEIFPVLLIYEDLGSTSFSG